MRSTHIPETENTSWFLLRGLACRNDKEEFAEVLERKSLSVDNSNLFTLIQTLCIKNHENWISLVHKFKYFTQFYLF